MTYEVSLTKWRVVTLAVAVCCLGGLLFFSGMLVGLGLWKPTLEELALAKEYRQRELAAKQAPVKTPSTTVAAATTLEHGAPAAPPTAEPAAPAEHENASQPGTAQPAAAQPAQSGAASPPPQIAPAVHEAEATPGTEDPSQFVLQVGSFRDAKNAKQLQSDLTAKGYPATVFEALDSEQRMWHVVRIGHYQDLASAAHEAAIIGGKEQLQALIRRGGRL